MLVNCIVHERLDRHALSRAFDEVLWSVRRAGIEVSTAQAIDWLRAVKLLGIARRLELRAALVAVVAKAPREVAIVERVFDRFFGGEGLRGDLFARLRAQGVGEAELSSLRGLIAELARAHAAEGASLDTALAGGASFDRLLALAGARLDGAGEHVARGWLVREARHAAGLRKAREGLGLLGAALRDAFGQERGQALAALLEVELRAAEADVEAMVDARREAQVERARARDGRVGQFSRLTAEEREAVRRAVRLVAEKLAGAERVRRRHAKRGSFDARATVRRAFRTGGVPLEREFRARRRDKPRLFLLCDVSESVRGASELLLEFMQTAQNAFPSTRSFVFVREVGEVTELLRRERPDRARELISAGAVVPLTDNSAYGRALRLFLERHGRDLDRRATVVVLGDGRTNWVDDGAALVDAIRARVRALVWLCPEPKGQWSVGDSAMARFAPRCTEVLDVGSVEGLHRAAQRLRRLAG